MTTAFELDCTELVKAFKELKKENAKLQRMLAQKESELRKLKEDWDRDEADYVDEFLRLKRQLLLAKSLVNIPDNLADCVKELIKERVKAWDWYSSESPNLDWIEQDEAPFFSLDLQAAFTADKNGPKGKGRTRTK